MLLLHSLLHLGHLVLGESLLPVVFCWGPMAGFAEELQPRQLANLRVHNVAHEMYWIQTAEQFGL